VEGPGLDSESLRLSLGRDREQTSGPAPKYS
jgi:hypothetical protein